MADKPDTPGTSGQAGRCWPSSSHDLEDNDSRASGITQACRFVRKAGHELEVMRVDA
jgi:hypothetical protein